MKTPKFHPTITERLNQSRAAKANWDKKAAPKPKLSKETSKTAKFTWTTTPPGDNGFYKIRARQWGDFPNGWDISAEGEWEKPEEPEDSVESWADKWIEENDEK